MLVVYHMQHKNPLTDHQFHIARCRANCFERWLCATSESQSVTWHMILWGRKVFQWKHQRVQCWDPYKVAGRTGEVPGRTGEILGRAIRPETLQSWSQEVNCQFPPSFEGLSCVKTWLSSFLLTQSTKSVFGRFGQLQGHPNPNVLDASDLVNQMFDDVFFRPIFIRRISQKWHFLQTTKQSRGHGRGSCRRPSQWQEETTIC